MRIIGLDIGSFSIKAVEIESGLRSVEVLDFFEEKLPFSETPHAPEVIREHLQKLFLDHQIHPPFKLISALSSLNVSNRTVEMPFRDKTKVRQTLPFELEEHIPFSLDTIIFDYQIYEISKDKSNVFTLIAPKTAVKEHLNLFETQDMNPDIVSTDHIVYANLSSLLPEASTVSAIINLGHQKTSVCILQEGQVLNIRSFPLGGQHITKNIETDYKLSYEEAENAKTDNGFVLTDETDATEDQKKFSTCIQKTVDEIVSQLTQTFQSHRSKGKPAVQKIFLTGKTSLLRNLPAYIAQETNIEVEVLKCLEGRDACNIPNNEENNAGSSVALALALGIVGRSYGAQFNFRKEDFSKYKGGALGKEVRYLLGAASVIILILLMNIFGNYFILKSTLQKASEQMEVVLKKFPIKVDPSLLQSPIRMRAFLNKQAKEQKEKLQALGGSKQEGLTTLEILKEISGMVPKEVLFDVRELSITDRKVRLKALSDSFNAIENIEKSFKNHTAFDSVVKGEISTAADGKNKNFTISFDVKGPK